MTKSPLSIALPTLLALGTTSAIAAQVPSNALLADEQYFVRGNGAEPNTLDPTFVNSGMPGDIIVNDMFEGFVIENRDGQIIPGQAKDWHFSNDGKTVTFTLKKDFSGQTVHQLQLMISYLRGNAL